MKSYTKNFFWSLAISALTIGAVGCKKDFVNPNAAPEDQVFTSARGMTAAAIGLQRTYAFSRAGSIYNIVAANGFVTNELILLNQGNIPELQLSIGGATVDGTNAHDSGFERIDAA